MEKITTHFVALLRNIAGNWITPGSPRDIRGTNEERKKEVDLPRVSSAAVAFLQMAARVTDGGDVR